MSNKNPYHNWKPGISGNPNGRPKKGATLTDVLRKEVAKMMETEDGDRVATRQLLARRLLEIALKNGDLYAIKYIYDRLDGKPIETIDERRIVEFVSIGLPPGAEEDSENEHADS
jgi:hypothetical protein